MTLTRPNASAMPPARKIIANHNAERNIRKWLDGHGFIGRSATFQSIELHAIKHPGWLQIFRFSVKAKSRVRGQWMQLYGAVRDDETARNADCVTTIEAFESRVKQQKLLGEWSQGLIKQGQGSPLILLWVGIAAVLFSAMAMIAKMI